MTRVGLLVITFVILLAFLGPVQGTTRFVVGGDSRGYDGGINRTALAEVVQATIREDADFILIVGDLVVGTPDQGSLQSQLLNWRNAVQPLYDAGIGVYPVRGNHDLGTISSSNSKEAWDAIFEGPYALPKNGPRHEEGLTYSFTYANLLIIGLDQYGDHDYQVNQVWLDEQLRTNIKPHVFVFGHNPAFCVHHLDCLDMYERERDAFWDSLASAGVQVYFSGHDHFFHHARIDDGDGNTTNDLHQYIVGSIGAALTEWDHVYAGNNSRWTPQTLSYKEQYGYLMVEVDNLSVTLTEKVRTSPGLYEKGGEYRYTVGNDNPPSTSPINPRVGVDTLTVILALTLIVLAWIWRTE